MTDDDNDDELTPPRERIVTDVERREHFARHPPGTLPVRELTSTPRDLVEHDLQQRIRTLEHRVEVQGVDVASLTASRRTWRWVVGLGGPALLSAAVALMLYSADKIVASAERIGATGAKIDGLEKLIDKLDQDVRELRRRSGLDPGKPNSSGDVIDPDKLSLLKGNASCTTFTAR